MRHRNVLAVAVASTLLTPLLTTSVEAQDADPSASEAASPEAPSLEPFPVVESSTGSYVVVMVDEPLVTTVPRSQLASPAAEAAAEALTDTHDAALAESGISAEEKVQDYTNALNGFSATLSYAQAVKLSGHPDVAYVFPDELRQITTDASPSYLQLNVRGGAWQSGLTGGGVVVGVIDTGIWPEHPSFSGAGYPAVPPLPDVLDDEGNLVVRGCDFGNPAHRPDVDVAFQCNGKLIGARQMLQSYRLFVGLDPDEFDSARDDAGHGTHTASTAAGNANVAAEVFGKSYGEVSGIAPRAQIISYKALGNLGGVTSDLVAAIDQAVEDGVDVINYSLGGGPDLLGGDAIAMLFAADAGVFIATSAGNAGDAPGTVGGPGDSPWVTTVAASTQDRFFRGTITLADGVDPGPPPRHGGIFALLQWLQRVVRYQVSIRQQYGASITLPTEGQLRLVDAESAGNDLCFEDEFDPAVDLTGAVVLCRRGGNGRIAKGKAVHDAGGAGMILYNVSDVDNLNTDSHWVPAVHVDFSVGAKIKQYIARHGNATASVSNTGKRTSLPYDPSITIFSSRGPNPTAADVIKPDITAPGLQILAGYTPYPDLEEVAGETFVAIGGTSMSSPHIAGLLALVRQAHPDWSAAAAKSALMTTANAKVLDNDRTNLADPFDTGSGHVKPGKPGQAGSMFQPGIVYDADIFNYLDFLCGNGDGCFQIVADVLPAAVDPSDLNYPSIGIADLAGTQTVTRTVTSVASSNVTWKAAIEAPAGYTATVEPSTISLAPGESASFAVTFTNDGTGEIGAWTFGSLTWKGSGGYTARSPIAVRGAAISTPDAVNGEGVDGTVSFPVQFGYTGNYSAVAGGLSPNTPTDGTVLQDPDQDPTTPDGGAGLFEVPVDLTGAALARWEMDLPDASAVDLDLYLYDEAGDLVASSFAGGTHELIELLDPVDGLYTMVVHGWQVPGGTVDFTLNQWVVPESGGNLTVTIAPTSAVVSTSGTIELAWTGAPPGRSLGAVTHLRDGEILAITTVEVDA